MRAILIAAMFVGTATAQSKAPLLEFEVASVKPVPPHDTPQASSGVTERILLRLANGRATGENTSLAMMIMKAYGVRDFQLVGPDWVLTERYMLEAKAPEGTPDNQLPLMLQSLLARRFAMKLHRDSKEMRLFELIVTPKGLTVEKADAQSGINPAGQIVGRTTMANLANILTMVLKIPVVDRTETPGIFDFKVKWESDEPIPAAEQVSKAFERQAGLRLEARKGPVVVLVIDHADKTPTEN